MNVIELWAALSRQPANCTVCIATDAGPVEITSLDILGHRIVLEARDMPAVETDLTEPHGDY